MYDMTMLLDSPTAKAPKAPVAPPAPPAPKAPPQTVEQRFAARNFDGVLMCIGNDEPVIMWHRDNPVEVAYARRVFNEIKSKGALLYRTDTTDSPSAGREQIREFDETAEQIVTVPAFQGG
jgi:hypothetical protein